MIADSQQCVCVDSSQLCELNVPEGNKMVESVSGEGYNVICSYTVIHFV